MLRWFWAILAVGCVDFTEDLVPDGVADAVDSGLGAEGEDYAPPQDYAIGSDALWSHLEALMEIAEANDGNRAAGTSGYADSVSYVRAQLEEAGYSVQSHGFNIVQSVWSAAPELGSAGGGQMVLNEDFAPFAYTGAGAVTAGVQAVDVRIPPIEGMATDSGCEASDFEHFSEGQVALLQRGMCTFQTKVDHAVDAGATAVLIFNEGRADSQDLFRGTLDAEADTPVPVFALTYAAGTSLVDDALAGAVEIEVIADFERVEIPSENLMVETGGDPERVVVIGGHLDSVNEGPGINDNGSGVATILELAKRVQSEGISPTNQFRFVFWGGEELGLLGSIDYITTMDEATHASILANLNLDMVASPNPVRFIYDGDGNMGGQPGPDGSATIEAMFEDWFADRDLETAPTAFDGRSDYGPFVWTGIPAGGLFTGAEQVKTAAQAAAYGGDAGAAYDHCYHQGCDDLDNVDMDMLVEMANATVDVSLEMGEWMQARAPIPDHDLALRAALETPRPQPQPVGCGAAHHGLSQ